MKRIPLTQGFYSLINDCDYELVSRYKWQMHFDGYNRYAIHSYQTDNGIRKLRMHRLILGVTGTTVVDHINGNGLDNRRENIRECEQRENIRNRIKTSNTRSRYKGVTWHSNKWRARISVGGKKFYLGCYTEENSACSAYDNAAKFYHGEFALTNAMMEKNKAKVAA